MKLGGKLSGSFAVGVGVRQGCLMSVWLFNIFMDGILRKLKAKMRRIGAGLRLNGVDW